MIKTSRTLRGMGLGSAILLLAGCAHYQPAPLDQGQNVLAAPAMDILKADAAKIDRPFLHPTAIDLNKPLDANAIGIIAVLENPDLKALRAHAGVTDAQAFAARLLPDPTLNLSYDKLVAGPDAYDNFVGQIVQDIAMLRERKVIAQQNKAMVQQTRLDLAWAEWQTAGAARLQAVRIL
ncbi:MAG: TolC family protein, partial [Alphaproteobacteria bacterium]|nr:TolC family protein [Alphaproteobacteria bacterium]